MSEVLGIDETLLRVGSLAALAVALAVTAAVLSRVGDWHRLAAKPRERFVFGVPWGTLLVIVLVVAVYYGLQGGGRAGGPIITGFRSWSLWYPQGIVLSSFAHFSDGHLTGNMLGTVAFAPLAEYVWRHYPERPQDCWRGKPSARIGMFVLAVGGVGILGSVIVPGAVIGFSGVVFAFAGFTIITAPVKTVFAIVGLQVIRLLYNAVADPFLIAQSQEQFVRPSWANIAVQGHLYGLLVGVLLGVALLRYRDRYPKLYAVFAAALIFAVSRSLQSVYWFLGGETYVLFTAVGAAGVFVLAVTVAIAARRPTQTSRFYRGVTASTAAVAILGLIVLGLALIGIPYNLASVDGGDTAENASEIEVRDYTVEYAENVEDQYISAVGIPGLSNPSVTRSGIIVRSDRRNSWEIAATAQQLESRRSTTVALGDATWRETVDISRTGWQVLGSNTTYKISGSHDGEQTLLYAAEPAVASPQINGTTVTIRPTIGFYELVVKRGDNRVGAARLPDDGGEVTIGGIQFRREGTVLRASHNRTEFQIAAFRP